MNELGLMLTETRGCAASGSSCRSHGTSTTTRRAFLAGLLLAVGLVAPPAPPAGASPRSPSSGPAERSGVLAARHQFSEPGGTFHSENFVSNEGRFQFVLPDLASRTTGAPLHRRRAGTELHLYVRRPRMAFIIDIRRGNLREHLLYKALMELSADRAEFLSRLFSRPRPAGLDPRGVRPGSVCGL